MPCACVCVHAVVLTVIELPHFACANLRVDKCWHGKFSGVCVCVCTAMQMF